ncbi:MAG: NAD(P)H-hydrate dehydratase [Burkholderiaceae bacterium]
MRRILPDHREHALFDVTQTRSIEARATSALPPHTLMQRAGAAIARLALAVAPHAERVWVAAGPGNNGGDGLEAAIHLARHGRQVKVSLMGEAMALPPDARAAWQRARTAGVDITGWSDGASPGAALDPHDCAIDALLGIGANRAPQGAMADAIHVLNSLVCPVLAADLPSGLHAETGQPIGDACVTATHTLALLTLKSGLFTGAGRDHAGTAWLDTLDVDTAGAAPQAMLSSPGLDATQVRRHVQHKGSFGDVIVVGGARGMTGAALLAARAAHAAGAGRIHVQLLDAQGAHLDPMRPELMFRAAGPGGAFSGDALVRATVVCGCGGGHAVREHLPRWLSRARRLLLDADALNAIAADTSLAELLRARARHGLASVLTPHPLEAARLLESSTAQVQSDRLGAAQGLADRYACVVVLKGSGSVIAAPGHTPRINATGNASLASAGTGDVLAGWLGGRWAQAAAHHGEAAAAFDVAVGAVAEHGAAAEPAMAGPLRAADLIEALHRRTR